jgi:hypothetical protein
MALPPPPPLPLSRFDDMADDNPLLADQDDEIERMLRADKEHSLAHQKARVRFVEDPPKAILVHRRIPPSAIMAPYLGQPPVAAKTATYDHPRRPVVEDEDEDDFGDLIPLPKKKSKPQGTKRVPPPSPTPSVAPARKTAPVQKKPKKAEEAEDVPIAAIPAVAEPSKPKKRKTAAPRKKPQATEPAVEAKEEEEVVTDQAIAPAVPVVEETPKQLRLKKLYARLSKEAAFPSEDDLEKCGDWVLLALFSVKLRGTYWNCPPDMVTNYEDHNVEASFLYYRHIYLRTQVAAAWQRLCDQSGNTDMSTIARMMPHCKLYIDNKAKAMILLHALFVHGFSLTSSRHQVLAQDAVCVWSRETTNLHPVALVPITEAGTMALASFPKEPGLVPIQFHIGAAFKDTLKCVHTLLFALDYIPFQMDVARKKAEIQMKGDWCPELEHELEEKVMRCKTGALFGVRKAVGDMFRANMNAFRAMVGPEIAAEFLVPFKGIQGFQLRPSGQQPQTGKVV